jgi:hypothetical protein
MGRDTTAGKRMAAKRSREKAAGLRRLNIALAPDVFGKLGELMKQYNCTSQAGLIELLVMGKAVDLLAVMIDEQCNEVTEGGGGAMHKAPSKRQRKGKPGTSSEKTTKDETGGIIAQNKLSTTQLSLFEI